MTSIKRPAAAAGAAVLLALSLTACGGGAPTDASVEEFCEVTNDTSAYEGVDPENPDAEKFVDAIKEQGERLEEVGTPEDIPDDAREGFELTIEQIDGLEVEDVDFEAPEDPTVSELSDDEVEKVEAFTTYQSETCAEEATTE